MTQLDSTIGKILGLTSGLTVERVDNCIDFIKEISESHGFSLGTSNLRKLYLPLCSRVFQLLVGLEQDGSLLSEASEEISALGCSAEFLLASLHKIQDAFIGSDRWSNRLFRDLYRRLVYNQLAPSTGAAESFERTDSIWDQSSINRLRTIAGSRGLVSDIYPHRFNAKDQLDIKNCFLRYGLVNIDLHPDTRCSAAMLEKRLSIINKIHGIVPYCFDKLFFSLCILLVNPILAEELDRSISIVSNELDGNITKCLISSQSLHTSYMYRILASVLSERRQAVTISCQHGASYGVDAFCSAELIEFASSDYFLSWGWETQFYEGAQAVAGSISASAIKIPYSEREFGHAVFVINNVRPHPFSLHPDDNPLIYYRSIEEIKQIVLGLGHIDKFTVKPFPGERDQELTFLFSDLNSRGAIMDCSVPLYSLLNTCRLMIFNRFSTGALEALSTNTPCICLIPSLSCIRPSAARIIRVLERVGIVHFDVKSLVNHVLSLEGNPAAWWFSKEVQASVSLVRHLFANNKTSWIENLENIIQSL